MHFLHTHLVTGSYRTCYADTDSMCLALTAGLSFNKHDSLEKQLTSMFDPIIRPEMRESWETQWKQWFVTTDTVEDQRWPGKLKVEFTIQKGHFVALCPKTYMAVDDTDTKMASKGIPHNVNLELQVTDKAVKLVITLNKVISGCVVQWNNTQCHNKSSANESYNKADGADTAE